jgi:heme oxygenase
VESNSKQGPAPTSETAESRGQLSMRQVLKRHSSALHQKLDALPALRCLLKAGISPPDYCRTLNRYALAYESVEGDVRSLEKKVWLGNVPPYTPRLPALKHDLDELDRWNVISRKGWPLRLRRRPMRTEWQYWGARYVLDGATQGSKFIALELRNHMPQLVSRAFAFWELQLRLAQEWTLVCERLAQNAPEGLARQEMLDGADIAFHTFISHFDSIETEGEEVV